MKSFETLNSEFFSDEKLQQVTGQIFVGHAILLAHHLGLFKLLSKQNMSIKDISQQLNLNERAIQALISCSCVLDLLEYKNTGYQLSNLGEIYLNNENPEYYGKVFDLLIQESEIMNHSVIKNAILSNKPQVNQGDLFKNDDSLSNTENFIASLHHKAFKPAFYWPKLVDFKDHKKFVDVGGGSGIHTIAACLNNHSLLGVICERPFVIPHTQKYIKDFDLVDRVQLIEFDMWKDTLPSGDIYFFGDIFHDWDKAKCILLAKKCFESLPENGQIILHEMLFNSQKTGPLLTAAYNMKMMVWTEGQQFSTDEISEILYEAGFKKVNIIKSLGNWSIAIGKKK